MTNGFLWEKSKKLNLRNVSLKGYIWMLKGVKRS